MQSYARRGQALQPDPKQSRLWGTGGAHPPLRSRWSGTTRRSAGNIRRLHAASTKVKLLIGVYGIYDLLAQWRHSQIGNPGDNLVESLLGVSPTEDRRIYFEASPISYATKSNNKTAVYLAWGTEDDVVDPRTQSHEFLLALKQAGFAARPCVVHGAPHYWLSDPIEEPGSHSGFLAPRLRLPTSYSLRRPRDDSRTISYFLTLAQNARSVRRSLVGLPKSR